MFERWCQIFVTFECWCSSDFHKIHASFECFLLSDILVSPKDLIEILALRARTLRTHPYSTKSFDRTCVGVLCSSIPHSLLKVREQIRTLEQRPRSVSTSQRKDSFDVQISRELFAAIDEDIEVSNVCSNNNVV